MLRLSSLLVLFAFQALACSKADFLPETILPENLPTPLSIGCDTCRYPIVMVHGFLASGDTWAPFQQLFTSNGYHPDLLHAFDWNSLNQGVNHAALLDAFINSILAKSGAPKVRLLGHSAGGSLCYSYLSDPVRAAKVDGYVHIGSTAQNSPAGPGGSVATLNIWSADDKIAQAGDIPGATNAMLDGKDHYQVATSAEAFAAVWAFFHGVPPAALEVAQQSIVCIGGKVLYFGENTPLRNAQVDIYEVDPATGARLTTDPWQTWYSDSLGHWGPTNVTGGVTYEFVTTPPTPGQRKIHYFREGFQHLNNLVYLRTIPPPPSLAGLLLAGLPNTDNQTVLNVFSASQAIVHGRDTLQAASSILSTAQFAPADKTAIAWFLYDDGNSQTELSPVGLFGNFPFLNGVDMYFPTAMPAAIPLVFNGRTLMVRNVKSSQGVVVGVFD